MMTTETPLAPAPYRLSQATEILLPRPHYASVIGHVVRKLTGHYLDEETAEHKAFGMLVGRLRRDTVMVTGVFPLLVNLRHNGPYALDMDEIVDAHAIPSQTPHEQRGWIAYPRELLAVEKMCDEQGWLMFGHYHTHRVAWPQDSRRDTCTRLDRVLAEGTGQWVFIVSAIDLHRPSLRAFYEGDNQREATIRVLPN